MDREFPKGSCLAFSEDMVAVTGGFPDTSLLFKALTYEIKFLLNRCVLWFFYKS